MVRTYVNALPYIYPTGTPYNTGDGIRMAQEVGADLWHMSNIAGPELFFKAPDLAVARWSNLPHVDSYIFVAADGASSPKATSAWVPTGTGSSTTTACGCSRSRPCRCT
jgi:hypothetical protein